MKYTIIITILLIFGSCQKNDNENAATIPADPMQNKGIGPITKAELGPIDTNKAKAGKEIFDTKCIACHKLNERLVGPPLAGTTKRRSPEWIMNLLLNTNEMVEKDPIVQEMVTIYFTKMTSQDLTEVQAWNLLDYLRQVDSKK